MDNRANPQFYKFYTGTKAEDFHILKSGILKLAQCFVVPRHPLKSNTFPPFK